MYKKIYIFIKKSTKIFKYIFNTFNLYIYIVPYVTLEIFIHIPIQNIGSTPEGK